MSEVAEDVITQLFSFVVKRLSDSSSNADGEGDGVEQHLAQSLSRVFTAQDVTVFWRHESTIYGRVERSFALSPDKSRSTHPIAPALEEPIDDILARLTKQSGHFYGRAVTSIDEETELLVSYGEADKQGKDLLIIRVGRPTEPNAVRYNLLTAIVQSYRTGWRQIFQLAKGHVRQDVRGRRVAAARALAEHEGEVRSVVSGAPEREERRRDRDPRLARVLEEARGLLLRGIELEQQASIEGHGAIAGDHRILLEVLSRWALNLVYGSGREDREVEEVRPSRMAVSAFAAAARSLDSTGHPYLPPELALMLGAAVGELHPGPAHATAPRAALLARWTLTHQCVQRSAEGRLAPDLAERAWELARAETLLAMPAILSAAWSPESDRNRSWLRLWFALRLISHPSACEAARGAAGVWRLRGDLAYVFRESLRLEDHLRWLETPGSGEALRPADLPWEFRHQPGTLRQAMSALVEHHATVVVGLPRALDLGVLIDEIGRSDGAEGHLFSTGHLQHVLDVYVFGQFLLDLHIRWETDNSDTNTRDTPLDDAPRTMAEALASRTGHAPGGHAVYQLRQTFALTSLFHDIGMRLFPHYRLPGPPFVHGDSSVETTVSEIDHALRATGRSVAHRCAHELSPYELLHPTSDEAMRQWIDRQVSAGEPDHALLGAWYLARMAQEVPDLPKDILLPALRAVLLHGVTTQVIDSGKDPVAALLVLCDELFDWDPVARGGPDGRSPQGGSVAPPSAPHRTRIAFLELSGFVTGVEEGGLEGGVFCASIPARLPRAEGEPRPCWPALLCTLHRPDLLGQPTWEVWLAMSQNLRRISASFLGWGPVVHLSGEAPMRYEPAGGTWRLLQEAVTRSRVPVRGHLSAWLDDQRQDPPEGPREELVIRAMGEALANRDLRPSFPALRKDADAILRERRGRGGPRGGG